MFDSQSKLSASGHPTSLAIAPLPSTMIHPPYKLLIVEADPIVRVGLQTALANFDDIQVVAEAESSAQALARLARSVPNRNDNDSQRDPKTDQTESTQPSQPRPPLAPDPDQATAAPIEIALIGLSLVHTRADQISGLELCQQVQQAYPDLPVLLLGSPSEARLWPQMQEIGVPGLCLRGADIETLAQAIRQVAQGNSYGWDQALSAWSEVSGDRPLPPSELPRELTLGQVLRSNLRRSGLRQIDRALRQITLELELGKTSWLERWVLSGRRRELRTSRWLVTQLLKSPRVPIPTASEALRQTETFAQQTTNLDQRSDQTAREFSSEAGELQTQNSVALSDESLTSALLDATVAEIQLGLTNRTGAAMELDALKPNQRRELLYTLLRQFEAELDELHHSEITPEQLPDRRLSLMRSLWESSLTEFLGQYYTVSQGDLKIPVTENLLAEGDRITVELLAPIPLVPELLAHLLFKTPLKVDQEEALPGSPAAMIQAKALLQNWIIRTANAILQPLLDQFSQVEAVKQRFFDRRLLSTRQVERFRNDLSWQYRISRLVGEPTAIFESQYELYTLDRGLRSLKIYAPRDAEMDQLTGLQTAVTLALEFRDAVSPRLRAVVSLVGSGLVYVLTEVIGRGIGLIGRGVIKGVGNAFSDLRRGRPQVNNSQNSTRQNE